MKILHGTLDPREPRSSTILKRTVMAVCGFVASLVLCSFAPTAGFAASILSFRAGLQPGGVRLVIDLDEPAEYSVKAAASTVLLEIDAMSTATASGRFPDNTAAEDFISKPFEGRTSLEVHIKSPSVEVRHYTLPMPDRIVLDLFPSPRSGGSSDEEPQVQALYGLIPYQPIGGVGKGYRKLLLSPEEFLLDNGLAVKTFPFDVPAAKKIFRGGSFRPVLRFRGPQGQGRARVVFTLNAVPLEGVVLDGAAAEARTADINLPASLFRPGKNKLTLAAMAEPKSGDRSAGGSLVILDGSILRLDYLDASDFSLGDMAAFLEGSLPFPDRGLVVVIPDKPESEEIQAAMELLLKWYGGSLPGAAYGRVMEADSLTPGIADSSHVIYLGRSHSLPRAVLEAFQWEPPSQGSGFLSCFMNNYGNIRLLVTSETAKGVLASAMSLLDRRLRGSLNAKRVSLPPVMSLSGPGGGSRKDRVTFKDLTGGDLVFSGVGKSHHRVQLKVPPGGQVGSQGEVSLTFRASPFIDGERSTLTLSFNGKRAASIGLGKSTEEKDHMTTKIPKTILEPGTLEIELEASLVPAYGAEEVPGEAFWVVVDGSSHVPIPLPDKQPPPLLENLPFLMGDREVTLFIGPTPGKGLLSALTVLLSEWRRTSDVEIKIRVKPLAELRWGNPTGDAVIAGSLEELFHQGIPVTAVRQDDGIVIAVGKKDKLALEPASNAFFQLLGGKSASSVLAVGWPTEGFAEPFPVEIFRSDKLKGDASIVSGKGEITPLNITSNEKRNGLFSLDLLPEGSRGRILLGAGAMGFSLALLWVLVFLGRGGASR